jgi:hypothetical protein
MDERIIYDGFERVWKIIEKNGQEIRAFMRESDQKFREMSQESDRKFRETTEEIRKMSQETDQKLREMSQESDRKFREMSQESERKFRETTEEIRKRSQETDQKFRETDRRLDKRIDKVSQEIGRLGGRWGEFIEEMVRPAVLRLFQQRGLVVHEVMRHLSSKRNGLAAEIDLLVTNDEICIAVEVKSLLEVDDVREHQERLQKFKILFPRYATAKVMGAVAGGIVTEEVAKYAYRQGFFVLGQKGENMEILNDDSFEPKIY